MTAFQEANEKVTENRCKYEMHIRCKEKEKHLLKEKKLMKEVESVSRRLRLVIEIEGNQNEQEVDMLESDC